MPYSQIASTIARRGELTTFLTLTSFPALLAIRVPDVVERYPYPSGFFLNGVQDFLGTRAEYFVVNSRPIYTRVQFIRLDSAGDCRWYTPIKSPYDDYVVELWRFV